jgi:hypothetical protein
MMESFRLGYSEVDYRKQDVLPFPLIGDGFSRTKSYQEIVKECRKFYRFDSIAGTVVNKMVDLAVTSLQNKQTSPITGKVDKKSFAYYNAIAAQIKPFLKYMALEYLLSGMAIAEYTTKQEMGSRISEALGRTRYTFPDDLWCRNVENITLKRQPIGSKRFVLLKIPSEDIKLVTTKGIPDRVAEYEVLEKQFPQYVADIKADKTTFVLDGIHVLYRKLTTFDDYPIPYLQNALSSLEHKTRLRNADNATAKRIVEAIRQIKIGDKDFPADDDTIKAEKLNFTSQASSGEAMFNLFTNHTISVSWTYPPMDALLSEGKYTAANLEIFMSLGFPRIWVNGETERSNAADNSTASVGPLATIRDVQEALLGWVQFLYQELADKNKFAKVPEPYFTPVNLADISTLLQYAKDYYDKGALSKNTIAGLYGTTYASEYEQRQIELEQDVASGDIPDSTGKNSNKAPIKDKQVIGTNKGQDTSTQGKDGDGDGILGE